MHILRFLFLFTGCGFFATAVSAQPAPLAVPLDHVTLRILSFDDLITDLAVLTPQGRKRLVARPIALSSEIDAPVTDGGVNFYRSIPPTTPPSTSAGKPAAPEPPAARFAIQPGVSRYLVIVGASGRGATRVYRAYATPDAKDSLQPGYARVINFTDTPLAVQLGEGSVVVGASQASVLRCASGESVQVGLKIARAAGSDEWKLMTSTLVDVPANRRLLLLIAPPEPPPSDSGGAVIAAQGPFELKVLFDTISPTATP